MVITVDKNTFWVLFPEMKAFQTCFFVVKCVKVRIFLGSGKNERTDGQGVRCQIASNNSSAEIRLSLTLLLLLLMCEIKHVYHRHFCWASTNCCKICSKLFTTYIHSSHFGLCALSSILFRLFCKVQQSINCNINIGKLYNFYRISHNYL